MQIITYMNPSQEPPSYHSNDNKQEIVPVRISNTKGAFLGVFKITVNNPSKDMTASFEFMRSNHMMSECNENTIKYVIDGLEKMLNYKDLSCFSANKLHKIYETGFRMMLTDTIAYQRSFSAFYRRSIDEILDSTILDDYNLFPGLFRCLHPVQIKHFVDILIKEKHKCISNFEVHPDIARAFAMSMYDHNARTKENLLICFNILKGINKYRFIIYLALVTHYNRGDYTPTEDFFGIVPKDEYEDFVTLSEFAIIMCNVLTPIMLINNKPLTMSDINNHDLGNDFFTNKTINGNDDLVSHLIKHWLVYYSCCHNIPIIAKIILNKFPLVFFYIGIEQLLLNLNLSDDLMIDLIKNGAFSSNNLNVLVRIIKNHELIENLYEKGIINRNLYDYYRFYELNDRNIESIGYYELCRMIRPGNQDYINFQLSKLPKIPKSTMYTLMKSIRKEFSMFNCIGFVNYCIVHELIDPIFLKLMSTYFSKHSEGDPRVICPGIFESFFELIEIIVENSDKELITYSLMMYDEKLSDADQSKLYKMLLSLNSEIVIEIVDLAVRFDLLHNIYQKRTYIRYKKVPNDMDLIHELPYIIESEDFSYLNTFDYYYDQYHLIYACANFKNGDMIINELLNQGKFDCRLISLYFHCSNPEYFDIMSVTEFDMMWPEINTIINYYNHYHLLINVLHYFELDNSKEWLVKLLYAHDPSTIEQVSLIDNLSKMVTCDDLIKTLHSIGIVRSLHFHKFLRKEPSVMTYSELKFEIPFAVHHNQRDYLIWIFENNYEHHNGLPGLFLQFKKVFYNWVFDEIVEKYKDKFDNATLKDFCNYNYGILFWESDFDPTVVIIPDKFNVKSVPTDQ